MSDYWDEAPIINKGYLSKSVGKSGSFPTLILLLASNAFEIDRRKGALILDVFHKCWTYEDSFVYAWWYKFLSFNIHIWYENDHKN